MSNRELQNRLKEIAEEKANMEGAGRRTDQLINLGKKAHSFVKSNRLVSRGALASGHPELAAAAHLAGYGIKEDIARVAKKAHHFVKSNRVVSRSARALGHEELGSLAHMAGYGYHTPQYLASHPGSVSNRDYPTRSGQSEYNKFVATNMTAAREMVIEEYVDTNGRSYEDYLVSHRHTFRGKEPTPKQYVTRMAMSIIAESWRRWNSPVE